MSDEGTDQLRHKSIRLKPDTINEIEKNNINLRELIEDGIDKKIKKKKVLDKKQKINKVVTNGLWICIGMLFFMLLSSQQTMTGTLIIFGFGAGFTILGAISLYFVFKEDGLIGKNK